jgi:uncharacterized 2Fe-2S/4Fe-4S cluster protein (DUF4445 family)
MPEIKIREKNNIHLFHIEKDEILLDVLKSHGYSVLSECGGNGTCGKCIVRLKGNGFVTSCLYRINSSVEVLIPEQKEAQILEAQYLFTVKLPFKPGKSVHLSSNPVGIALDLGTTTLVFYFADLKNGSLKKTCSMLNPQYVYGADVISRIAFAASNPQGTHLLQESIISAINNQLNEYCKITKIDRNDIVKVTVTGNNTMLHLLVGENPSSMGQSPYIPLFTEKQERRAVDAGLHCNQEAELSLLPSVSAFIGADIVAGIASIQPREEIKRFIFIDLGTNGELALVTPTSILCCATAAGPAFEGANISCGMGAVEGAVAEFTQNGFHVIGDGNPIGVCGSGLVDIVAYLIEHGKIDSSGCMEHEFEIVQSNQSGTGNPITLTQQDIRQVQLAKSAIMSGIKILLEVANISLEHIDALFLAGGFGNYMNLESAIKIGLIPEKLKDKVILAGNTSGTGALISLRASSFDSVLTDILNRTRHIELAEHIDFAVEFAMNMAF